MGVRILIVEDEPKLAALLRTGLQECGYAVDEAHDGETALELATPVRHDLILLDVLLPGLDGIGVCRALRAHGHPAAILMLTARDAIEDRIAGLDEGADDYLVKPFALPELLARIRALLRRGGPARARVLRVGDLELDTATREVRRAGRVVELARREYAILECLIRHPNHVLTRDQIAEHVWDLDFSANSNVIDVYVATLRRKLGDRDAPQLLHTIRGVGYQLRPRAPE